MFTGFVEWVYDEKSGYHFNAATGYYYDPSSGLYYSDILGMVALHLRGLSEIVEAGHQLLRLPLWSRLFQGSSLFFSRLDFLLQENGQHKKKPI